MLQQTKQNTFCQKKEFLQVRNIQSVRCHHDELVVQLESYTLKREQLPMDDSSKYAVLETDSKLTFRDHLEQVKKID